MVKSRRTDPGHDVEAPTTQRSILPEAVHGADMDDTMKIGLGCCGLVSLGGFIGLIVLLCSIHTLGPEEQVVIEGGQGKYVLNGPRTSVLSPSRKKTFRQATRLGPREYAVVKNTRTGLIRHEAGPKLLWLEAYDEKTSSLPKIVLQLQQYVRLKDQKTGKERVVVGPQILIPEVLEIWPNGTEQAIVLSLGKTVLVLNRTSGLRSVIDREGVFHPQPYEDIIEVREAISLGPMDYVVVNHTNGGVPRNEEGPQLFKLGVHDRVISYNKKIVLMKDQYCRLVQQNGVERIVRGPQTFVPKHNERMPEGVKRAIFLDTDTAVLVLDKETGQQRLNETKGVWMPQPNEVVVATQNLIRVLPQEAILVRDASGRITIHNGAEGVSAFFLPPYTAIVQNNWSDYGSPPPPGEQQMGKKVPRTSIDLRTQKVFFRNEVRTSDNVKLQLDGTVFWKVVNVSKMLKTQDPEGDVWQRSRSALIAAVSRTTLNNFMASFNNISNEAYQRQTEDSYFSENGIEVQSMELTRFECTDASTSLILQQIIQETVNRINRLQVQESENEVRAAAMKSEIKLELQRTELIRTKAENARLQAEMDGDVDGMQLMRSAATFIDGLNESVPDVEQRVALYSMHQKIKGKNKDTANLAAGNAKLFLTAEDVNLRMNNL